MVPLVSINLCCYNSEKYLGETLQSILDQTYQNWELIIVDDGSTDQTKDIIFDFKKRGYPIIYEYHSNRGLSYSRNVALNLSNGYYIAFIDHDDLWLPEKLERQVRIFQDDSEDIGMVYTYTSLFGENTAERKTIAIYDGYNLPEGYILDELLFNGNFITFSSVMTRRDICIAMGGFPSQYTYAEDYYLITAIAAHYQVRCVRSVCCKYRVHGENSTHRLKTKGYCEIKDIFLKWYPYLGEKFKEKRIKEKLRQIETMIGIMMIRHDKNILQGLSYVLSKGSFLKMLGEVWRYGKLHQFRDFKKRTKDL